MHINFNKNWPPYSWVHNIKNGIQFESIPISNTENGDFKHSDYPPVYIDVLLALHVFDCDVMGVPCEGVVCEYDRYSKFVFYCANE